MSLKTPGQPPAPLPVVPVLAATTTTQALTTLAALALAAVAPSAARDLGVSPALIGYQVAVVYFGAMLASLVCGGLVRRYGAARTSQLALWISAAGCVLAASGSLWMLAAGAFVTGLGYGITNPAASQLLSRLPAVRHMNLLFSIKQCGVPIGGVLAGVLMPPLTLALGWQVALLLCALALTAFGFTMAIIRADWDADRDRGARPLGSPLGSIALVWRHKVLRWLALSSFLYSGVQLCLTGFLVTFLVSEVELTLLVAGTVLAITHAAGAAGRLAWGWFADRLRSGTRALMVNGALSIGGALATAAIGSHWPVWGIATAAALFGFCAMGWNGVFMAVIARQSPRESIGIATGGSLSITYAGVVAVPPAFAALHDYAGLGYGAAYGLLTLVIALGIACVVQSRRAAQASGRGQRSQLAQGS